jgi:hypothetical protein
MRRRPTRPTLSRRRLRGRILRPAHVPGTGKEDTVFRRIAVILSLSLLIPATALALEKGEFEVGLGVDFHHLDDSLGLQNPLAGHVRLGWSFRDNMSLEAIYYQASTKDDFGDAAEYDVDLSMATVNLVWGFGEETYQPFALVGFGYIDSGVVLEPASFEFEYLEENSFLWQLGLGCRWRLSPHLGIRVQFLGSRADLANKGLTNLSAGVDVSWIWGKTQ